MGARRSLGGGRRRFLSCKAMFSQLKAHFRRLVRLFFPELIRVAFSWPDVPRILREHLFSAGVARVASRIVDGPRS